MKPAKDRRGNAVLEFALVTPLLLLILVGLTEIGRAYYQANAVEKGLRAGALYAARGAYPLTAAARTAIDNLVRTGTLDGTGALLVSGWRKPAAGLEITVFGFDAGGATVPVIRLAATVPFDPMMPGMTGFVGIKDFTIRLSHEQAYLDE